MNYPHHRDLSGWSIIGFIVSLILFGIFVHVVAWNTQDWSARHVAQTDVPRSAWRDPTLEAAVPLQPTEAHHRLPKEDLQDLHRQENDAFDAMGWKQDPQTHRRLIPQAILDSVCRRAS